MCDYIKLATVYVDDDKDTFDIIQALVNAGFAIAYSLDYREIYILKENGYDRK